MKHTKHTKQTIRKIITDALTQDKEDNIRIGKITQSKTHRNIWDVGITAKEFYIFSDADTIISKVHMIGYDIHMRLYHNDEIIRIRLRRSEE